MIGELLYNFGAVINSPNDESKSRSNKNKVYIFNYNFLYTEWSFTK